MIALESELEKRLALFSADVKGYLEAPTVISRLNSLVIGQRESHQAHFRAIGEASVPPMRPQISAAFEGLSEAHRGKQEQETVATLRALATAFTETAFGHAVLHALCSSRLAVDDREVGSYQDMLDGMREHQPGEDVKLRVRRGSGELEELTVTW